MKTTLKRLDHPAVALAALAAFIALAFYSQHQSSLDFIDAQLSQYDSAKTRPHTPRPNIKDSPGIVYQRDLSELYGAAPVVIYTKDRGKDEQ